MAGSDSEVGADAASRGGGRHGGRLKRSVCHPKFRLATRLPFISAAQHTVKFPPKGPWSFTTATRTGKVPLKVPSSLVWVA